MELSNDFRCFLYGSLQVVRELAYNISKMGDVDTASPPDIIITDQDEKSVSYLQPHFDQKKRGSQTSNGSIPHANEPQHSGNGAVPGHGSVPGHTPPDQNTYLAITTKRHGSNGSAHGIRRDSDKPLDTTVNLNNLNTSKDINAAEEKDAEAASDGKAAKQSKLSKFSLRAAFSHRDKKKKCLNVTKRCISSPLGVLCLIIVYLSLGACLFMALERPEESRRRTQLIRQRYELTGRLTDCTATEEDPTECLLAEIKTWEKHLVLRYPVLYVHLGDNNSSEPKVWNWPNAFYGCFSVITTIGYGTIAPITPWGRLIVIVYAIVGIPLMLLLVADIGSQLARLVKIVIIAVRKRKEKAHFWKNKPKHPDDKSPTSPDRDTSSELKGHANHGLDMNEDVVSDTHARTAHLNGVSLHLEVAHNDDDSDSSYSSCSNCDQPRNRSAARRRKKKKKNLKRSKVNKGSGEETRRHSGIQNVNGMDGVNNERNSHGITIQIDCEESSDTNDQHHSRLYDAVRLYREKSGHSDFNGLPTSHGDHQIKDYDSISQCSDQESKQPSNIPRNFMLGVPRLGGGSHSTNDTDDGIASISSSIHTTPSRTPSNAPTEIYRSDEEGLETPTTSRSVARKESDSQIINSVISLLPNGDVSDSGQSQSAPNSPNLQVLRRKRIERRPSSVSINLACLDSVHSRNSDVPLRHYGRVPRRRRRSAVKFGAAMGSFSSVSENDIAVFSIPLWLALLLLFIYLLIGAICYSFMEGWHIIDSFYYAFISLSTIGFGDLYFVPESFEGALIFNFVYCFIGLSFVSMVWGLSSREFTLFARKIGRKLGYYKSRRWRRTIKGWSNRMRERSVRRWSSRRRNAMKVPGEGNAQKYDSDHQEHDSDQGKRDRASQSDRVSECLPSDLSHDESES